ncbi:MAG: hypothetical protein M3O71_09205 [Bacteroidota bacterium]|nr:hypothetical protein [Bacteroidota bacterium]
MRNGNKFKIAAILSITIILFSFVAELKYRTVAGGDLKMLIPRDFIHVPKESFKPSYPGDKAPDDFYCNADTSESIGFLKIPKAAGDLEWCRQLVQGVFLASATKIYFSDTAHINGNKTYIAKFDGTDVGKLKYMELVFIGVKDSTIIVGINCDVVLKNKWMPISDQILKSVRLN